MKDGQYGAENPDVKGGWDGMVGELVRKVSNKTSFLHSIYKGLFSVFWKEDSILRCTLECLVTNSILPYPVSVSVIPC